MKEDTTIINRHSDNVKIEKCVICGAETPYKFSDPIGKREYYVEGAGQTCVKCHRDLYSASKHTD